MNQDMKWKFLDAKAAVDWHNANADKGLHFYKKEVNEFALMVHH